MDRKYHVGVIRDIANFVSTFEADESTTPKGIKFIIGVAPNKKRYLCKVLFCKKQWSEDAAHTWLLCNKYKPLEFTGAVGFFESLLIKFLPTFDITVIENNTYLLLLRRRFRLFKSKNYGVYLHHWVRPDREPHHHSHPWDYTSILLKGSYIEETFNSSKRIKKFIPIRRKAEEFHKMHPIGDAWTLVIRGPEKQVYGFLGFDGWIPWYDYNDIKHPAEDED